MSPNPKRYASNPSTLSEIFPYQSLLDSMQLQHALQIQNPNEPLGGLALKKQVPGARGRLVALHPRSETPVAVQLGSVEGSAWTDPIILVPGQRIRVKRGGFQGLNWGLPFGWLGGGVAALLIADNEDSLIEWVDQSPEIIYHRLRLQIVADANPSTTPLSPDANWPIRFPWVNAARYNVLAPTTFLAQGGKPLLAPTSTKIVMRLRVNNLASDMTMRMIWQGTDPFDGGASGNPTFTDFSVHDVTWPNAGGYTSTPYPVIEVTAPAALAMGGDYSVLTLSNAGNAALTGQYVDILRYGRL